MPIGLRTVIYRVLDIDQAKAWYTSAFEVEPYFDMPFYVGFQVGGFELGLDPDLSEGQPGPGGALAYWGVVNIEAGGRSTRRPGARRWSPLSRMLAAASRWRRSPDPFGNPIGLIENPNSQAED